MAQDILVYMVLNGEVSVLFEIVRGDVYGNILFLTMTELALVMEKID